MRNIRRAITSSRRISEFYSMRRRRQQQQEKENEKAKQICPVCECTPCDCHWGDQ